MNFSMDYGSNGLRIEHIELLELSLEGLSVSLESVQPSQRTIISVKMESSSHILAWNGKFHYGRGQLILWTCWLFKYLQGYNYWTFEFSPHLNKIIETWFYYQFEELILMLYHRDTSLQMLRLIKLLKIVQGLNYWVTEIRPYRQYIHNFVSSGFDYQTDQIETYINTKLILCNVDLLQFLFYTHNISKQEEKIDSAEFYERYQTICYKSIVLQLTDRDNRRKDFISITTAWFLDFVVVILTMAHLRFDV